jgi:hypothetical protein
MAPRGAISKRGRNPTGAMPVVEVERRLPKEPTVTTSPTDPGFSRDPELEQARGTGRPAKSEMSGEDHTDDPAPERHIHFSPDPEQDQAIAQTDERLTS